MANLTMVIDERLLQAARIEAAQQGASVNEACCGVLFTEDLQDGMRFGELRVANPFVLRAREPDTSTTRRAGGGAAASRQRARRHGPAAAQTTPASRSDAIFAAS